MRNCVLKPVVMLMICVCVIAGPCVVQREESFGGIILSWACCGGKPVLMEDDVKVAVGSFKCEGNVSSAPRLYAWLVLLVVAYLWLGYKRPKLFSIPTRGKFRMSGACELNLLFFFFWIIQLFQLSIFTSVMIM